MLACIRIVTDGCINSLYCLHLWCIRIVPSSSMAQAPGAAQPAAGAAQDAGAQPAAGAAQPDAVDPQPPAHGATAGAQSCAAGDQDAGAQAAGAGAAAGDHPEADAQADEEGDAQDLEEPEEIDPSNVYTIDDFLAADEKNGIIPEEDW
jgi:hypothetical protein